MNTLKNCKDYTRKYCPSSHTRTNSEYLAESHDDLYTPC